MKIGDKVKIKEKFWKIESGIGVSHNMEKLAGRDLEVDTVNSDGTIHTKQDDSNDDTRWHWDKNWVELIPRTIDDVREDDLITNGEYLRRVLGREGKVVFTTYSWKKGEEAGTDACSNYSIQELKDYNFTIVNETIEDNKIQEALDLLTKAGKLVDGKVIK